MDSDLINNHLKNIETLKNLKNINNENDKVSLNEHFLQTSSSKKNIDDIEFIKLHKIIKNPYQYQIIYLCCSNSK